MVVPASDRHVGLDAPLGPSCGGGLSNLRFFPDWLTGLKAIVAFLRSSSNCAAIGRNWRSKGCSGAANMIEGVSLPTFAE